MTPPAVTETNLHLGSLPDDPTGVADCQDCNGSAVINGQLCPSCSDRQALRNAWWASSGGPEQLARHLDGLR